MSYWRCVATSIWTLDNVTTRWQPSWRWNTSGRIRRFLPWQSERSHPVRPEVQAAKFHCHVDIKKSNIQLHGKWPEPSPSARIFSTVLVLFAVDHPFPIVYHLYCVYIYIYSFVYFMSTEKIWDQLFLWFSTTTPSLQTLNSFHPRSHVGKMFWHTPSGRIPRSIQGLSFLSKW